MKKLLLIASALLAFTFFGCEQPSNSTTPDTGKSDVVVDSGDDTTKDDDTTGDDTTGDDTTGDDTTGDDTTGDDTTGDDTTGDEGTEVVVFEVKSSYQEEAHCKEIGNKTALSEFAGKTVVLTIKYLEGDRNNWGIGEVFFATDNADLYNTKTGSVELTGTAATDNICTIEYPVDDVIAAMGDAEYISINLWNQTELVKISVK